MVARSFLNCAWSRVRYALSTACSFGFGAWEYAGTAASNAAAPRRTARHIQPPLGGRFPPASRWRALLEQEGSSSYALTKRRIARRFGSFRYDLTDVRGRRYGLVRGSSRASRRAR